MFVIITDPTTGNRLGRVGLQPHVAPLRSKGFRISSRHGVFGMRGMSNRMAYETREEYRAIKDFVGNTGFSVTVHTTQREANALMGTFLPSNGTTSRLAVTDEGRVATYMGHGR